MDQYQSNRFTLAGGVRGFQVDLVLFLQLCFKDEITRFLASPFFLLLLHCPNYECRRAHSDRMIRKVT